MTTMYTPTNLSDYSVDTINRAASELRAALDEEAARVYTAADFKAFRDRWRARKSGVVTQITKFWLGNAPPNSKRDAGFFVNLLAGEIDEKIEWCQQKIQVYESAHQVVSQEDWTDVPSLAQAKLASGRLDITLPGIHRPIGVKHPVLRVMDEIVAVFKAMGYSVGEGPEVETDYYNFESLNFPPNHPARDTQDTLFIAGQEGKPPRDRLLLRTHTSPVQIRTMEKQPPPVRIVIPGKVHRNDPLDATHSPVFHQVEGLAVDTNITFCDLKGTLDHAMKALFGSSVKTRFYPSFFPFTEPSADMQVSCIFCGGKGCRKCKFSGWIELLGCGMVDPNVFDFVKHNGYDSSKISGFAFGMGVERIAMLKYEVEGIQLFYEGDVRFLEQFG
ncbi:MAG TPA: phenylalanine--tRNA ligase subunit alpha [Candidatus Binatia bacterium]|nr:phenylalanine--tRNA ligase subunit alpha [Candidatus Binatia bacterium]